MDIFRSYLSEKGSLITAQVSEAVQLLSFSS